MQIFGKNCQISAFKLRQLGQGNELLWSLWQIKLFFFSEETVKECSQDTSESVKVEILRILKSDIDIQPLYQFSLSLLYSFLSPVLFLCLLSFIIFPSLDVLALFSLSCLVLSCPLFPLWGRLALTAESSRQMHLGTDWTAASWGNLLLVHLTISLRPVHPACLLICLSPFPSPFLQFSFPCPLFFHSKSRHLPSLLGKLKLLSFHLYLRCRLSFSLFMSLL